MSSDVLITGGAGFIGCALSEALVRAGAKVVVVDVLHPQVHTAPGRPRRLPADVDLLPMDVANATNWDTVLKLVRPDTVVHLAAEHRHWAITDRSDPSRDSQCCWNLADVGCLHAPWCSTGAHPARIFTRRVRRRSLANG